MATKVNKTRLIILVSAVLVFWCILVANFFRWQIVWHEEFAAAAERQYLEKTDLPAQRGLIYDRNGYRLATNTIHYDLAVDPLMVKRKDLLAEKCARAFGRSKKYYLNKLNQKNRFVYLERKVPAADISEILKLKIPGLIKKENFRRKYPLNEIGAQLIGFTDTDDRGLSGLELQFDEELKGLDGQAVVQYDGRRGHMFYNADNPVVKPENGMNIVLTIDKNIQTIADQELRKGVLACGARSGMALVMDPKNGAVLAMSNFPTFNPNRQNEYSAWVKKNRTITDLFEPGSTAKLFSAALLLQEHLKKEDDIVFCENGAYRKYKKRFTDTKKYGWLSFKKAFQYSSNIGMIKLSEGVPANTMFRYLKNFGFGSETGIGLTGEAAGILDHPQKWSGLSKASISIGYGIGVTALQMITAYSAAINGGYLYRPFVIDRIETADGDVHEQYEPKLIRQIVSGKISEELKSFMLAVVQQGTGRKAAVPGLEIGGKTGTALKMNDQTGRYYSNKYIASFIGFVPFEEPQYVCAVIMDEPKTHYYGGQVAAPVFREIIRKIVPVDRQINSDNHSEHQVEEKLVRENNQIPPMVGYSKESAIALMRARNIDYRVQGSGPVVTGVLEEDDEYVLKLGTLEHKSARVPGLVGLTLREAVKRIDMARFRIILKGASSGIVRKQSLTPGTEVNRRTDLILTCN